MSSLDQITVPFEELHDTLGEFADMSSITATKRFKVAWSDRVRFYRDVAGYNTIGGKGSALTRVPPLAYPDIPGLYASSISTEPVGRSSDGAKQIQYDWAYVTVGFSTFPWNFSGGSPADPQNFTDGTYLTESIELAGEVMSMPQCAYKFLSTNDPVVEPVGKIVPLMTLGVTEFRAPYIPFAKIIALIGTVNDAPFYGCPRGTVLFLGASSEAETTITGVRTQRLTYKFSFRAIEWNKFLMPRGTVFDYIVRAGDPTKYVYDYASWVGLFFTADGSPI